MKSKRLIPGVLAGMLMLTTVASPLSTMAAGESKVADLTQGLVGYYSFDEESLKNTADGATEDDTATAIKTGLGEYTGTAAYDDAGQSGKAVRLGDYGLKLNKANLGDEFTVSAWMKSDGTLGDNQSVLFLGYHDPEKWLSVAGTDEGQCKMWANGNGYKWKTFGTMNIGDGQWHCLTLTGDADNMTCYLDGEKAASAATNTPLTGSNQDIYIGVTNWDTVFAGLVDEVKVYNRTLSEGEIYQLYDPEVSAEDILEKSSITATKSLKLLMGRSDDIAVDMPAIVKEADPAIEYKSDNTGVATVNADGKVMAVAGGTATITTSVTIGNTTKTAKTTVTVSESLEGELAASYDFNGDIVNEGTSGNTASAVVKGLNAYNGEVVYEEGKDGKAIRLGDYGLKLNEQNLGDEYTVSLWLKPDGTLAENQSVLFMGYHDPEKWLGVSGEKDGTNICKVWAKGDVYTTWTTLASPEISSEDWHQLTLSGTAGKVTAYLDGISFGTKESNDPLSGANQDIYLGVTNWDLEFTGLMDDVKVYRISMTEAEVQAQAKEEFQAKLQAKLKAGIKAKDLLGENDSADHILYDLELPETVNGMEVTWTSDNAGVIGADGVIANPTKETEVKLTATVTYGTLTAAETFTFKAPALDKTELEELLKKAEAIDTTYLTEVSKTRLTEAIANAKAAKTYSEVETAYANLERACTELYYVEDYTNPFTAIQAPVTEKTMKPGDSEQLFTLPDAVKDMVDVEYESEDESVATYAEGKVEAVAEGKTVVTVYVTSKYDKYTMEYSTAIDVAATAHTHIPSDEWTSDDKEHWKACTDCGEVVEKAPHTTGEWIVDKAATKEEAGSRHKECTVCKKVLITEEIPKLADSDKPGTGEKPDNGDKADATDTTDSKKASEGSVKTGDTTQALPIVATLLGTAVVMVVVVNKKRSLQ